MPEPIPTAEEFGRRMTTQQRGSVAFATQADVTVAIQSLIDAVRLDQERKTLVDAIAELEVLCGNELWTEGVLVSVRRLRALLAKLEREVQDATR